MAEGKSTRAGEAEAAGQMLQVTLSAKPSMLRWKLERSLYTTISPLHHGIGH